MPSNPFFKRLFLVIAVISPIFWLVFSAEGQRLTDIFFLSMGGDPELRLNYEALHPAVDEAHLRKDFPEVDFNCEARTSTFGNYVCHSKISDLNGIPARYATFFFAGGHLTAAKLVYRRAYHQMLVEQLTAHYGVPGNKSGDAKLIDWNIGAGTLLMMKAQPGKEEEPAMMWLARPAS